MVGPRSAPMHLVHDPDRTTASSGAVVGDAKQAARHTTEIERSAGQLAIARSSPQPSTPTAVDMAPPAR